MNPVVLATFALAIIGAAVRRLILGITSHQFDPIVRRFSWREVSDAGFLTSTGLTLDAPMCAASLGICRRSGGSCTGSSGAQQFIPTLFSEFGSTELAEVESRVLAATFDRQKTSPKYCWVNCNSNQRSANICINFSLFRLVVLRCAQSPQGTSTAHTIFDGTGVENYFVNAAMVDAVYQFRMHSRSVGFQQVETVDRIRLYDFPALQRD